MRLSIDIDVFVVEHFLLFFIIFFNIFKWKKYAVEAPSSITTSKSYDHLNVVCVCVCVYVLSQKLVMIRSVEDDYISRIDEQHHTINPVINKSISII